MLIHFSGIILERDWKNYSGVNDLQFKFQRHDIADYYKYVCHNSNLINETGIRTYYILVHCDASNGNV